MLGDIGVEAEMYQLRLDAKGESLPRLVQEVDRSQGELEVEVDPRAAL